MFYGSQTGTAEEFANRLSKDAHRYGMRGMAADPEEYDLVSACPGLPAVSQRPSTRGCREAERWNSPFKGQTGTGVAGYLSGSCHQASCQAQ